MRKKTPTPKGFVSIRTSTLAANFGLPMNVFVYVNNKPIRYAAKNDSIESDRLQRLHDFQMLNVYIKDEDEAAYRNFLESILDEAETNTKIAMKDRAAAVQGGSEAAVHEILLNPESKLVYEASQTEFERFGRFIRGNEESIPEILKLSGTRPGDYVFHGVQVGTIAYLMSLNVKGIEVTPAKRKSLLTGAFLHDIDSEKQDLQHGKAVKDMAPDEKRLWDAHPKEGTRYFGDKEWVDRDVLEIIWQHEEVPNGTGFPKKLTAANMNPLAILVSFANTFDHYSNQCSGKINEAFKKFAVDQLGRYDLSFIDELRGIFKKYTV